MLNKHIYSSSIGLYACTDMRRGYAFTADARMQHVRTQSRCYGRGYCRVNVIKTDTNVYIQGLLPQFQSYRKTHLLAYASTGLTARVTHNSLSTLKALAGMRAPRNFYSQPYSRYVGRNWLLVSRGRCFLCTNLIGQYFELLTTPTPAAKKLQRWLSAPNN